MPTTQQIRSEEVQDILTRVPHWMIVWGNSVVLVLLSLFLMLSYFIKYPDVIVAESKVTSVRPPQKELAQLTGKIDTILVTDNQKVQAGTILAMMQNSARLNDVLFLKHILDTLTVEQNNFTFPVDKIPLLSLGEISSSFALFETDFINYKLNNTLAPYSNKISANRLTVAEIQMRIKNLDNQKQLDAKSLEFSKNEFHRNKTLYDKGVISLQEFETKEMAYLTSERNFKNLDISLSQLKQALGDAYRNSKETQINNDIENIRLYKNAGQSLNQLKEAIKNWESTYLLTAEIDGNVSFMGVWNAHQSVNSGDLIFSIIPKETGNYIAKVKAPIQNSGKIKLGQKVNIKLFNYPDSEYGALSGTVASMSAIPNTAGFYLIDVSLQEKLITSYNIEIPFKTELSGTAEIITEDLRLIERFFYQLRGIFS
jgi:multidrug resistance efflux pump